MFFSEISHRTYGIVAPYNPNFALCDLWTFGAPKAKSTFKGTRFQAVNDIKETMTRQLMVIPKRASQIVHVDYFV